MARPSKITISKFPFDVDFFNSKIMVCIAGEFGVKGEIAAVQLLCAVYKEGYFMKWSMYQRALMTRLLPGISQELLDQILSRLLKWGFFDEGLFRSAQILTSVEIQKNYFNAIKRRTGIDRGSFPFLLLDPAHPNDVSAYKTGVSVCNNSIPVYNNLENVAETEVLGSKNLLNVLNVNKNPLDAGLTSEEDATETEKGLLYTKTGVSVYKNSKVDNKNTDSVDSVTQTSIPGPKNPLEEYFDAKKEFLHTETGVSANKNSDLWIQKPIRGKDNNSKSAAKTRVNVGDNSNSVNKNGEKDNRNSNSDSNNPANIIYNINNSSSNSRSSCCSKESEQNFEFGEQKGEECYQNFDEALKELKSRQAWRESVCMNHQISQEEFDSLFEKFSIHCKADGTTNHSSMKELMSHFNRWIPYSNLKPQNLTKPNYGNNELEPKAKTRIQRRGTEANSKKEKNYHASFSTSIHS